MQSKAERSSPGGALPPDDAAAKMIRNLIYGTHKEAAFKSETLLSDLSNGGDIYGGPYHHIPLLPPHTTVVKGLVRKDLMVEINCIPPQLNLWHRVVCIGGIEVLLDFFDIEIYVFFHLFFSFLHFPVYLVYAVVIHFTLEQSARVARPIIKIEM
jgi:hypothetical protein